MESDEADDADGFQLESDGAHLEPDEAFLESDEASLESDETFLESDEAAVKHVPAFASAAGQDYSDLWVHDQLDAWRARVRTFPPRPARRGTAADDEWHSAFAYVFLTPS